MSTSQSFEMHHSFQISSIALSQTVTFEHNLLPPGWGRPCRRGSAVMEILKPTPLLLQVITQKLSEFQYVTSDIFSTRWACKWAMDLHNGGKRYTHPFVLIKKKTETSRVSLMKGAENSHFLPSFSSSWA